MERASRPASIRYGKWAGLFAGLFAAVADQQIVSMTAYAHCPPASSTLAIGVGAVCLSIAVAGGAWSLYALAALGRMPQTLSRRADRLIGIIAALTAALAVSAIVLGTMAGLILRCER